MEDIFFHMLFVVPLTRWITSIDRPWNRKSTKVGACLALVALFIIGMLQSTREPNHFETIGVPPNAPPRVVSSTYRKLSLQYHPAHEVIGSEKRRDAFCRFGDFSTDGAVDDEHFYDVLLVAVFHCLIPFVFGYLHTFGDASLTTRQFFCSYLALVFASELLLRFDSSAYGLFSFMPFVGSYLPFEKVVVLHNWVPIVLNALLLLGPDFANQQEELREEVCRHLLKSALDNITQLEAFLEVAEGVLVKSGALPLRVRWARAAQLEAEAAAAAGQKGPPPADAAERFVQRVSARRLQQRLLREKAKEEAEVAAVFAKIPFKENVNPKIVEAERKAQLTALGFTETSEPATPWRLNPSARSEEETPDLWGQAMDNEARTWPEGLELNDLLRREDCTTYGFDLKRKGFLKLLDRYEEDAEKGSGISLGSVIFFGMIFFRWYSS
ncbi:hypothetical protein cyc_04344 [Cyclospora cayetanensis]|uniref:DnaJ domain-containing protein n=1 Tax=Cyclospora cayetanensis TaxID=88456 RepID=A0A1D3D1I0_9EIME|nr:hypothetical protein cyc_04344 [Cyclospora cayetanensis]